MLTIREQQMLVFAADGEERFVASMVGHLRRFFPEEAALLGPEQLDSHVRNGIAAARRYSLKAERDLCYYLNLSMLYGTDLGARQDHRRLLNDADVPNPSERIARLYHKIIEALETEANNRSALAEFQRSVSSAI